MGALHALVALLPSLLGCASEVTPRRDDAVALDVVDVAPADVRDIVDIIAADRVADVPADAAPDVVRPMRATRIAAGGSHTCTLVADGTVRCC